MVVFSCHPISVACLVITTPVGSSRRASSSDLYGGHEQPPFSLNLTTSLPASAYDQGPKRFHFAESCHLAPSQLFSQSHNLGHQTPRRSTLKFSKPSAFAHFHDQHARIANETNYQFDIQIPGLQQWTSYGPTDLFADRLLPIRQSSAHSARSSNYMGRKMAQYGR